jgi:uncharacterized membrane protein YgdD (TMEM256/DUF423 family)
MAARAARFEGGFMAGKFWIAAGAVLAAAAVAAGAIGAHLLRDVAQLEPSKLETYEVAVRYQMYHALALVLVGVLQARRAARPTAIAGWLFALGIVLFSGGIYGWLATDVTAFVQVVPVGGTAWIAGWLVLAAGAFAPARRVGRND